jgi:hypothetical protein
MIKKSINKRKGNKKKWKIALVVEKSLNKLKTIQSMFLTTNAEWLCVVRVAKSK